MKNDNYINIISGPRYCIVIYEFISVLMRSRNKKANDNKSLMLAVNPKTRNKV